MPKANFFSSRNNFKDRNVPVFPAFTSTGNIDSPTLIT